VAGVSSLRNGTVGMLSTVCVDLVGAVVLHVVLAVVACEIGTDLSSNTNAVSNLDLGDLAANLDGLADDLVSNAERKGNIFSPSSGYGVDIRGADTASINGDVNIIILELLERKLGRVSDSRLDGK
jgi:hypothetical protein